MGRSYGAICDECDSSFEVNDGSGMIAMPFHCDQCGREWWWQFGPGGPKGKNPNPPACKCEGTFNIDAPARCPRCGSIDLRHDPRQPVILYD